MTMSSEGLMDRLRRQALATAHRAREASIQSGVRTFVRLNLSQVLELRATVGTWDGVAELLWNEGLRWSSGQRVTGAQLRSLASALRRRSVKSVLSADRRDALPSNRPSAVSSKSNVDSRPTLPRSEPGTTPVVRPRGLADLVDSARRAARESDTAQRDKANGLYGPSDEPDRRTR